MNKEEILVKAIKDAIDQLTMGRTFFEGYFDVPFKELSRADRAIKLLDDGLKAAGEK